VDGAKVAVYNDSQMKEETRCPQPSARILNRTRASSSKTAALSNKYQTFSHCTTKDTVNIGVERYLCQLPKLNVVGSIPISRSIQTSVAIPSTPAILGRCLSTTCADPDQK
jgi:hypothetical protein